MCKISVSDFVQNSGKFTAFATESSKRTGNPKVNTNYSALHSMWIYRYHLLNYSWMISNCVNQNYHDAISVSGEPFPGGFGWKCEEQVNAHCKAIQNQKKCERFNLLSWQFEKNVIWLLGIKIYMGMLCLFDGMQNRPRGFSTIKRYFLSSLLRRKKRALLSGAFLPPENRGLL